MNEDIQQISERREHPRHMVNLTKSLEINNDSVPLFDISWGGLSFYSKKKFQYGQTIKLNFNNTHVEASVLGTMGSDALPAHPHYPFCVRCQFVKSPDDKQIEKLMDQVLG